MIKQEIKDFISSLNNDFIEFNNIEIYDFNLLYQIKVKIRIRKLSIIINYGLAIPFRVEKLTDNLKESLTNAIKIDINKYIIESINLDKLGE